MGLSVSASRVLWPGCGYGPRQQRLGLTGAVHNALWCTSNCPDISLNWANAPPALQSALLHPPHPPHTLSSPLVLKPELLNLKSAHAASSAKVQYHFNLICAPILFHLTLYSQQMFFIKSEHGFLTVDHLFCFNKGCCFYDSCTHAVSF